MTFRAAALLALLLCQPYAFAADALPRIRLGLEGIQKASSKDTRPFHESERVLRLYDQAWTNIGDQARTWLGRHPDASSERLAAAIEDLSPAAAERCRHDAWANEVAHDIQMGQYEHSPSFDLLDPFYDFCWAVDARAIRLGRDSGYTYAAFVTFGGQGRMMLLSASGVLPQYGILPRGPGGIRTLPDDAEGRHRFYVDARPADEERIGASACRQIAVFSWNGHILDALVDYHYFAFKGADVVWNGTTLEVETKGEIRSFGVCGACTDLDARWRLDVTPDGVQARDLAYDQPLFAVVDEFITHVQDGAGWYELGSPEAARNLARLLASGECERPCAFGSVITSVRRAAGRARLSLAGGAPRGTVTFEISERDDRRYIDGVRFEPNATRP